jgi:hypothetical protein
MSSSGFSTKTPCAFIFFPTRATYPAHIVHVIEIIIIIIIIIIISSSSSSSSSSISGGGGGGGGIVVVKF